MKKYILGAVFLLATLSPAFAQAQSSCTVTATYSTGLTNCQADSIIGLLQAFNANQSVLATVRIVLTGGAPTTPVTTAKTTSAPTITSFTASTLTVQQGNPVRLTWAASANATSCYLSGQSGWQGATTTAGSSLVYPTQSGNSYFLSCSNSAGTSATKSVNLSVSAPAPSKTAPIVKFLINGGTSNITVAPTESFTLQATSANGVTPTKCYIDIKTDYVWGDWTSYDCSKYTSPVTVTPSMFGFTKGAGNAIGISMSNSFGGSAGVSRSVTVQASAVVSAPTFNSFTISPNPHTVSDSQIGISWSANDATDCYITGQRYGAVMTIHSTAGTSNTNYVLSCTGPGGTSSTSTTAYFTQAISTTVNPAPVVTISPNTDVTMVLGGSQTFTSTATDASNDLTSHWMKWISPDGNYNDVGTYFANSAGQAIYSSGTAYPASGTGSNQLTAIFTPKTTGLFKVLFLAKDSNLSTTMTSQVNVNVTAGSNTAPTIPTVTGPINTTGPLYTNTYYQFNITGTDPEFDNINYGIDLSEPADGSVDKWVFAPDSYSASGDMQATSLQWATVGTHTFNVRTHDELGLSSPWKTVTITINGTSEFGPCSKTCGGGIQTRTCNGAMCSSGIASQSCNLQACVVAPTGTWSYASSCPTACSTAASTQTQTCSGGNGSCSGTAASISCSATAACVAAPTGTWSPSSLACPTACGTAASTLQQTCSGGNGYCSGTAATPLSCPATAACYVVTTPDLTVSTITPTPATGIVGQSQSFSATVTNSGTGPSASSNAMMNITVVSRWSNITVASVSGPVPLLAAGASAPTSIQYTFTSAGTYTVTVCADANGTVKESNETNNCSSLSFVVSAPTAYDYSPNQIAGVAGAVGALPSNNQPQESFNYVWNQNLQIGSPYVADVTALQTALTKEGVYSGEITGGFYNQTFISVKAFQQKYGIETTGFVGLATRAKLNSLYSK